MLAIMLLLGAAATLSMSMASSSDSDEQSEDEVDQFNPLDNTLVSDDFESPGFEVAEIHHSGSPDEPQEQTSSTDISSGLIPLPESGDTVEVEFTDSANTEPQVSEEDSQLQAGEGLSPLEDWTSDPSFPIVELSETDELYIEASTENATVRVQRADYFERIGSEAGLEMNVVHTGANVFVIEEGHVFPDYIQWSESGAVSYVANDDEEFSDAMSGVRHVARIDTGIIYEFAGETETQIRSQEVFESLQDRLTSDGILQFFS